MKNRLVASSIAYLTMLASFSQQKPLFDVYKGYTNTGEESYIEIKDLILENYYYDGLTENDLYWASIEGMLRHISPPENPSLAQLWTDEEYEKILNSLKGIKVSLGFGSSFNTNDGSLTVTSLTNGSEAEAKLRLQDRIVRIDGQPLAGKSVNEVNELLDGDVGQVSNLKVVRDITIFDIALSRDTLKNENLIVTRIPGQNIALIEAKSFSLGISGELERHLFELQSGGTQSLILDLRNNLGGVLNEGINMARLFMKNGDIVLRTQARSKGVQNYSASEGKYPDFKIAILVNENTASASEIVTSALKDHDRAFIVGKKTFGKGVIENTYTLKNNYRVKFISNAMYSPKGKSWQSTGLLPDYFVDQTQSSYNSVAKLSIEERMRSDLHLSTAVKLLNK
ncbi:MAG: S41 family peptidase [Cyclobacteriaceae bacterium]